MCSPDLAHLEGPPSSRRPLRPWAMAKRSRVELYEQIRKVREREGVSMSLASLMGPLLRQRHGATSGGPSVSAWR